MGKANRHIRNIFIILGCVLLVVMLLLNLPAVQRQVGVIVASALEDKVGTRVDIGGLHWRLPSDIVIDSLHVDDQDGNALLTADRLAAKVDWKPLIRERHLTVRNIRLFHPVVHLTADSVGGELNCQFILDAFGSEKKDTTSQLNLSVGSLLVRNAELHYDILSEAETPGVFNTSHAAVEGLDAHFSIKELSADTLSLITRQLSLREQSGFTLTGSSFRLIANHEGAVLADFEMRTPQSSLRIDTLFADYSTPTLQLRGTLQPSTLATTEIGYFLPAWKQTDAKCQINAAFKVATAMALPNENEDEDENGNGNVNGNGNGNVNGNGKAGCQFDISRLSLHIGRRDADLLLKAYADLRPNVERCVEGSLLRFSVSDSGWNTLHRLAVAADASFGTSLTAFCDMGAERLGPFALDGTFDMKPSRSTTSLNLDADAAKLSLTADMDSRGHLTAALDGKHIDVGRLAEVKDLGTLQTSLNIKSQLDLETWKPLQADINGTVNNAEYKGYTWQALALDGQWDGHRLNASLDTDDPNAMASLTLSYDDTAGSKVCVVDGSASRLNIHNLHLTEAQANTDFAFNLSGRLTGNDIESMRGIVTIDSFTVTKPDQQLTVDHFTFQSLPEGDRKYYTISSDFLTASATGYFTLATLGGSIYNLLAGYEPVLASTLLPGSAAAGKKADHSARNGKSNELSFSMSLADVSLAESLFDIPISIRRPITVDGCLFESMGHMELNGHAPSLVYDGNRLRNIELRLDNSKGPLSLKASGEALDDEGAFTTANITANMDDDAVIIDCNLKNSVKELFEGAVTARADFSKDASGKLVTRLSGLPSSAIINSTAWTLAPFSADISAQRYAVSGFCLSNGEQLLAVEGSVAAKGHSHAGSDSLLVQCRQVDIEPLIGLLKLEGLTFGGRVTGTAGVGGLLTKTPHVNANLNIQNLAFCEAPLGDASARVGYDDKGIIFNITASERANDSIPLYTLPASAPLTVISGTASIADGTLDLLVEADSTDIGFLDYLLVDVMADVKGRGYGSLRINGPFDSLDMEGDIMANNAAFTIVPTGVRYRFDDYIRMSPGQITFDKIVLYDDLYDPESAHGGRAGALPHTVILDGWVRHNGMVDWSWDFNIKANEAMALNIPDIAGDTFYSTVFALGEVRITGADGQTLHVGGNARTCQGSVFALNLASGVEANEEFITFRDRDQVETQRTLRAQRSMQGGLRDVRPGGRGTLYRGDIGAGMSAHKEQSLREASEFRRQRMEARNIPLNNTFELDLQATITPDATIKLVMDQSTDDNVSAYGSGNLRIVLNDNDVLLYGTYTMSYGFYRLSLQELLHKDFEVVNGSTVIFDGNPLDARLDVTAQHIVNSVSLSDLSADAAAMDKVRVNCLLGIGGTPSAPQLSFNLELPQGTEEQRTLLQTYTATEEQRDLQFVYLLGLGKFYTYDYSQNLQGTQGGIAAMESLLSSTISGQINSLISNLLPSNNWSLSSNIRSDNILGVYADEELFNNMEIQGILEGRLLDNRLLVNGNFGYRDNPMYASNFIGDFDIRYLLFPGSNLWLKGYNKTNDRYFSRTALTTQGIGLIFSRDFDRFGKKTAEATDTIATTQPIIPSTAVDSTAVIVAPTDTLSTAQSQ